MVSIQVNMQAMAPVGLQLLLHLLLDGVMSLLLPLTLALQPLLLLMLPLPLAGPPPLLASRLLSTFDDESDVQLRLFDIDGALDVPQQRQLIAQLSCIRILLEFVSNLLPPSLFNIWFNWTSILLSLLCSATYKKVQTHRGFHTQADIYKNVCTQCY